MNVSEIMDAELRYLAIQGATLAIRSLAQAELDRRNPAVEPAEKVKYWRHKFVDGAMCCKTEDGCMIELHRNGDITQPRPAAWIAGCWQEITQADYEAAKHPAVSFAIEGKPATAGECAAFIQGVQSAKEAMEAINKMNEIIKAVNEIRKQK